MSAHKSIGAVQVEMHTPSLDEIDELNVEPMIQTLANGQIPSNYQINDSIDRMKQSIEETKDRAHLSDKGEKLVQDMENILETAQHIINDRNSGDAIQHLVRDSKDAAADVGYEAGKQLHEFGRDVKNALPHLPSKTDLILDAIPMISKGLPNALDHLPSINSLDFEGLTKFIQSISTDVSFNFPTEGMNLLGGDAKNAYNLIKEIALYAARSKDFRELLNEFVGFFHGTFGDVTAKLQEVGESVKMDIDSGDATLSHTRDVAKKDGQELVEAAKDAHPLELTEAATKEAYEKLSHLLTKISEKPEYKQLLDLFFKYVDEVSDKMHDYASEAMNKASELADNAAKKGEEIKDKAVELKDKAEDTASGATDMVIEKGAELKRKAEETAGDIKDDAKRRTNKVINKNASSLDKIWNDVRDVIDNFGGKGTFDSFYIQTYNFYARLYNDKSARRFLHELRDFASSSVKDSKALTTDKVAAQGKEIIARGRKLIQGDRYKAMFNKYFHSWSKLLHNFSNDSLLTDFSDQLRKFAADFALDSKGRPDIYALEESLGQVKTFIYPVLVKQLENMKLAKINGASDSYDWSIDHLSVGIANFIPETFDLRFKNHLKMNVKDLEAEQNNTRIVLDVKALKPHFNDVKFWYRRKSFPHIEDAGVVDVDLSAGEGTRVKIIWKIKSKHNRPYAFSLMEVKCVVDKIDIKIKDAKHDILDRMAASLFTQAIKHEIADGIVNAIVDVLHPLNDSMNKWFASRPIGHITDQLNEKLHDKVSELNRSANKAIKNHPVDRLMDSAMEIVENVEDAITDKVDRVIEKGEKIGAAASAIGESASLLKRKAEKTLSEDHPGLRELKEATMEKGSEIASKVGESASNLKDAALEKGADMMDIVKENVPKDMEDAKKKASELKDAAIEKATEMKDAAEKNFPEATKKVEQAVEKGSELASKAKDAMPKDMEDAKKKAGELKDAAVEKASELKDAAEKKYPEATKKVEQAVEKGTELAQKAKENIPKDMEDAKKKAGELKDAAVDKATELKDGAMEKAGELKDAAEKKYPEATKKAEQVKDAVVEKGTEAAQKVKENMPKDVEDAKKKAGELKDAAVEKGSEVAEKVKENLPKDVEDAKKKAGELKDAAVEKGSELAQDAKKKAGEAVDAVEKEIELKDDPVKKGVSYAAVASGDKKPRAKKYQPKKEGDDGKWHSHWEKPSKKKVAHKAQAQQKAPHHESKQEIREEKIAANPYEALNDESVLKEKKAH